MSVVEYKLEKRPETTSHQRWIPDWVGNPGHWWNPINYTFIGWDNRAGYYNTAADAVVDYYLPTPKFITKEEFVQRQLDMHAVYPFKQPPTDGEHFVMPENRPAKTEADVRAEMEAWYDNFVAEMSGS